MAITWHPTYDLYEVHGSRQEQWNDVNPSVTVVLQMDDTYNFRRCVEDMVLNKYEWPENNVTPYDLYVTNVEVLPIMSAYTGLAWGGGETELERIGTNTLPRFMRVTYGPVTQFLRTIDTSNRTGTSTAYGFQTQDVWVEYNRIPSTEFLTLDFNDFAWKDTVYKPGVGNETTYPPVLPDEAPGMVMRFIKFVVTYRNIYLTADLEDILYNYSGTVNNSSLTLAQGGVTFTEHQVLFSIENVQYTLNRVLDMTDPATVNLVNLTCSFKCMKGDGTWNKFWRPKRTADGSGNDAGWYPMYYKKTAYSNNQYALYEPYTDTNYWYCLWV